MTTPTEKLCNLLATEQLDKYLFRSQPAPSELPNVFGGQVLAQALNAAIRTVDSGRLMHSMHAYFLRPGNINKQIIYEVDPIRDGGSFTTRRVVAKQDGVAIFNTSISFKTAEKGCEHQTPMPSVPMPDELVPDSIRIKEHNEKHQTSTPPKADVFRAFETRTIGDLPILGNKEQPPAQGFWFKTVNKVDDELTLHQILLTYASDFRLMLTAMLPHEVFRQAKRIQMASLDHALWLHRPFRTDEWVYYHMIAPSAQAGTGINFGRFYNIKGELIASSAQEGLIRIKD